MNSRLYSFMPICIQNCCLLACHEVVDAVYSFIALSVKLGVAGSNRPVLYRQGICSNNLTNREIFVFLTDSGSKLHGLSKSAS